MNGVVLQLCGIQGRLNEVEGDLWAFCDDLDQVCEVVRSFEAICESCGKFKAVASNSRKSNGVVVMWNGIGCQFQ